MSGRNADNEFDARQRRFRQRDVILGAGAAKCLLQDCLHFQPYFGVVIVARHIHQTCQIAPVHVLAHEQAGALAFLQVDDAVGDADQRIDRNLE